MPLQSEKRESRMKPNADIVQLAVRPPLKTKELGRKPEKPVWVMSGWQRNRLFSKGLVAGSLGLPLIIFQAGQNYDWFRPSARQHGVAAFCHSWPVFRFRKNGF